MGMTDAGVRDKDRRDIAFQGVRGRGANKRYMNQITVAGLPMIKTGQRVCAMGLD
jgi:hypothetical protein